MAQVTIEDTLLKELDFHAGKGQRSKAIRDAIKMYLNKPVYVTETEVIKVASLCDCQNLSRESSKKLISIQKEYKTLNKTEVWEHIISNYGGKLYEKTIKCSH
jgi:metal-responsive CopG/Arc/MetJ family transcriptional regulator